jgi:cytochrome c556
MRVLIAFVIALVLAVQGSFAQAPAPEAAAAPPAATARPAPATMKELMLDLIFPTSDTLFYVARGAPKTDAEWLKLELYSLTLAEAGNVLNAPGRAFKSDQWRADAQLLVDVGLKFYRAAKARDHKAMVALNDELYESCQSCHVNFRPGYRRRP